MKMRHIAALAALAAAGIAPAAHALEERTVTIDTRPGVRVGFVLVEPDRAPVASAILFSGGSGKLRLGRRGGPLPLERGNFLVRTRRMFAGHGILVAVVDAPSDRRADGLDAFRHTEDHRRDIAAVVGWLRAKAAAPVWLIGTSRGTVSVAHLAARIRIDGVVFTASVTESGNRRPGTALDARLEDITAPALIVHNRDDDCRVTPSSNVGMIRDRLKRSAAVEVMMFSGGTPTGFRACSAMSYHGFLGIEDRVVGAIAGWIRARAATRAPQ